MTKKIDFWADSGNSPPKRITTTYDLVLIEPLIKRFLTKLQESSINDSKTIFDKKIWTIKDVIAVTGFSKQTIYNKTSKDEIPHRKIGGKLFFMPQEIIDFIDEGELHE